jgi:hypothetical protein
MSVRGASWWSSFSAGGVDDVDVQVLDEDDDVGSGVGSADADGESRPW